MTGGSSPGSVALGIGVSSGPPTVAPAGGPPTPAVEGVDADAALAKVIVGLSPNGVLVTDASGLVRTFNQALCRMVPLVPDPIGRTPIDALPIPAIAEALSPGRTDEAEFPLHVGRIDLLVRVVPLGAGLGRLCVVQDVSRLRQAERYRQEFVANVSHELRTPATAIAGFAETLLHDPELLAPPAVRMVETILRNSRRLTDLFDDLLQLARLDAMDTPPPLHELALKAVVDEVFDKHAAQAAERRIRLVASLSDTIWVLGHREAMQHLLGNLVSNGIKYTEAGGEVQVRARPRHAGVIIEVIDNGIGIDPTHHERIFERFYRVDRGRARSAGGTGLGLAIVKHLAKSMKATVEVRSRPGRGSTFRVWIRGGESGGASA